MNAKPKKLRSGKWGALVEGAVPQTGDVVTITTSKGKSWQATVERVLWSGKSKYGEGTVAICATRSVDSRRSHGSGCACSDPDCECNTRRCLCAPHCNCRGGSVYDC